MLMVSLMELYDKTVLETPVARVSIIAAPYYLLSSNLLEILSFKVPCQEFVTKYGIFTKWLFYFFLTKWKPYAANEEVDNQRVYNN